MPILSRFLIPLCLVSAACEGNDGAEAAAKIAALHSAAAPAAHEWRHYLGDQGSAQYSPLTQVNRDNVESLEVAWTYDPDDAEGYLT